MAVHERAPRTFSTLDKRSRRAQNQKLHVHCIFLRIRNVTIGDRDCMERIGGNGVSAEIAKIGCLHDAILQMYANGAYTLDRGLMRPKASRLHIDPTNGQDVFTRRIGRLRSLDTY